MRNLKRALSLTLASVMLLGMMVFGTSAASFTDADQITNVMEATVLQELNVMQGSGGKFSPNQIVTRGQMAILICKILYGDKVNVSQFAGTSEFTDVPANAYYTGYVNMASSLGVISGYGNGKFGPGAPVTTAQAALMLCRALGYFQGSELEGQNWSQNALTAITKATQLNMFGDMKLSVNDGLSRDNVAKMVFNTMTKAVPVEYNKTFDTYYNAGRAWTVGVNNDFYADTLGCKNFDLVNVKDVDSYGRPGLTWGIGTYKLDQNDALVDVVLSKEITHDTNEPLAVYTKKMTSSSNTTTVERDLRGYEFETTVGANQTQIVINGATPVAATDETIKTNVIDYTADGVVVEVYAGAGDTNSAKIITDVVVYRPEKAEVSSVNAKKGTVTLLADHTTGSIVIDEKSDFYDVVKDLKVDDIVVIVAENKDNVIDVYVPRTVTGKITEVKVNSDADKIAGVDNARYTISSRCTSNFSGTLGKEATVYLDRNDFALYIDAESVTVPDYMYLTNLWVGKDVEHGITKETTYARGVDANGETITLKVDNKYNSTPETGAVTGGNFSAEYGTTVGKAYAPTGTKGSDGTIQYLTGTTASYGVIVEYKQSTVDPDRYLLVVPKDTTDDGDGVGAAINTGLSNTARRINNVYISTGVKFVFVNYTRTVDASGIGKESLSASAVDGVQSVTTGKNFYPVVWTNDNNEQRVVTVFVADSYVNDQEVYYIKDASSYKVQYQDGNGKTRTGYKAEIWLNGEKMDDDVILYNDYGGGFFLKDKMDGDALKLKSTSTYPTRNSTVADTYGKSITAGGVEYLLDNDTAFVDVTGDYSGVSVGMIESLMKNHYAVEVSVQYKNVGNDKVATYVYVTDVIEGVEQIVVGPVAGSNATPTVQTVTVTEPEDTVVVLAGEIKGGIPTGQEGNMDGIDATHQPNGGAFLVNVAIPGSAPDVRYAYRITSGANKASNWNSFNPYWEADGNAVEKATGVRRGTTSGTYAQQIAVLCMPNDKVTVEVWLNCPNDTTGITPTAPSSITETTAAAFDAKFDANVTYTITIDTTGVTGTVITTP